MNNRNWNMIRGVRVGNNINNNDEQSIKLNIKIKRIVNLEFSKIKFVNDNKNINKYFKWVKS